jgi:two-component system nitrate/nitrite response regulator NarL
MFVTVTRRAAFHEQWELALARRGESLLTLESVHQLEGCLKRGGVRLVVIDFALPGAADPAVIRHLQPLAAGVRLLAAGVSFSPQTELATIASGLVAACDQSLRSDELTRIVDMVLQGGIWISRASIPLLVGKLQGLASAAALTAAAPEDTLALLSPREREVASLVGQGANNKAIGDALSISERTVKSHLTTIFEKLDVSDRLQLALFVTRRKDASGSPARTEA